MATMAAAAAPWSSSAHRQLLTRRRRLPFSASFSSTVPAAAAAGFGWADALRVAGDSGRSDEADLSGYFRKVDICNRGMEKKGEFVEFMVEDHVVGYIHNRFLEHLRDFRDVFTIVSSNNGSYSLEHVSLHSSLRTPEDRTLAIGNVIKSLGDMIPALSSNIVLRHACILLSGTCCCSLLWYKSLWSSYERVC